MSGVQLLSDELEQLIPGLLAGSTVVALVPATELRGWAAEMAWRVARATAAAGRRTVLIDCFVEAGTLHGAEGATNEEGLVDAFEYGASLNRIVQQQPQADLFFIPAGTYAPDAEPVLQNPRWRRLSAGFRHEEALLLLYVGAEHLATIPADPDGIVVLAPQGQDLAVSDAPALAEAVAKGLPLLAVVADEQAVGRTSAAPASILPVEAPAPGAVSRRSSSRVFALVATLLVALLGTGTALRFGALGRLKRPAPAPQPAPRASGTGRTLVPITLPPVESLPFALEVAILPGLALAFAVADSLEAHGSRTMIAPFRVGGRGVRYRLLAGPFATRLGADSARVVLTAGRLLPRGAGRSLSAPVSLALGGPLSRAGAAAERARLRRAGVAAFVLGQADGTFRLYTGAFDRTVSMTLLQDLLTPTGGAGDLVPRLGYVP